MSGSHAWFCQVIQGRTCTHACTHTTHTATHTQTHKTYKTQVQEQIQAQEQIISMNTANLSLVIVLIYIVS